MENKITKHKWFWAWEDEKEEAWLTQMAAEGWHLSDFAPFGFYTFEAGPARKVIYRLDFQYQSRKQDRADYLQLFADAGWEHVGQMANWQYFRREVKPGEQPELFTDVESKIQKYGRVTVILVVILPILLQLPLRLSDAARESDWYAIPLFLVFCLLLVYIYAMLQLIQRISQLKKSRKLKQ
jgi:hypothetical protein